MNETLETILLGIIEGITEFLPISSTGHLLIAQHWLGSRSELFNVVIQVGAILGVVVVYWQRLLDFRCGFGFRESRLSLQARRRVRDHGRGFPQAARCGAA